MQRHFDKEYISLTLSIWEKNGVLKDEARCITPVLLILVELQHTAARIWLDLLLKAVVK